MLYRFANHARPATFCHCTTVYGLFAQSIRRESAELVPANPHAAVARRCEAVLVENEIDSLESLHDLTKQDMLDIGLKVGTVVKLQRK